MKKITNQKLYKKVMQYELAFVVTAVLLILATGLIFVLLNRSDVGGAKHLVAFYDHGVKRGVLTQATTVRGALRAANIKIDPRDKTDPSPGTKLSSAYTDVIIYRSRLIAIRDGGIRQSVLTVAQSPNAILGEAKLDSLKSKDKATFIRGDFATDKTATVLVVERAKTKPKVVEEKITFKPKPNALTVSKGAQVYIDSQGVAHRETYYDLPMNIVIGACEPGNAYTIRSDGAKIDKDGSVLVAANFGAYPRCTVVDTSLGPGKVYDTGGFAARHPYGFDLATDWTNYDGQ